MIVTEIHRYEDMPFRVVACELPKGGIITLAVKNETDVTSEAFAERVLKTLSYMDKPERKLKKLDKRKEV